ncbi:MAG: hypothetical protein DRP64_15465, partial [Verrucomicrobia bacterium]
MEARGLNLFYSEIEHLRNTPPYELDGYRNAAQKEYDERGESGDFEKYLGDFAMRLKRNNSERLYEDLVQDVREGKVGAVRHRLEAKGLNPNRRFSQRVVEATEMVAASKQMENLETNRTEVHDKPYGVQEPGPDYNVGQPSINPVYDVAAQIASSRSDPTVIARLGQQYNPAFVNQIAAAAKSGMQADAIIRSMQNQMSVMESDLAYGAKPVTNKSTDSEIKAEADRLGLTVTGYGREIAGQNGDDPYLQAADVRDEVTGINADLQDNESMLDSMIRKIDELIESPTKGDDVAVFKKRRAELEKMREPVEEAAPSVKEIDEHLESAGVKDKKKATEEIQLQFDSISNSSEKPYIGQKSAKKAISMQHRKTLSAEVFQLLRVAKNRKLTAGEKAQIQEAFDLGIPVSSVVKELFTGEKLSWPVRGAIITSPKDVMALAMPLRSPYAETLKVLWLDKKRRVIKASVISLGTLNASYGHPRQIFGDAPEGAAGMITVHNHPSGNVAPSAEDISMTKVLTQAGESLGLPVLDHVITNGWKFLSLRESGLVQFSDADSSVKVPKDMKAIEHTVDLTPRVQEDWEVVPRDMLDVYAITPSQTGRAVEVLRQASPNAGHLIAVNTQNQITMIDRFDFADAMKGDGLQRLLKRLVNDQNAAAFFLDLPTEASADTIKFAKRASNASTPLRIRLLDVLVSDGGLGLSLRESGLVSFAEDQPKYSIKEDRQQLPPHIERIKVKSAALVEKWRGQVGIDALQGLTGAEASLVIQYAAAESGYDPMVEPVPFESLPEKVQELFKDGNRWKAWTDGNAEALTEIRDTLGLGFEAQAGFYFPMRHFIDGDFAGTTMADMVEYSKGVTEKRTGTFGGVIQDPLAQVEVTMRDSANLIAVAGELGAYIDNVADNVELIAFALEKRENGDELTPKEEKALEILDEARAVEDEATKAGIYKQAKLSDQYFASIRMLETDGGGGTIPNISNLIKPHSKILKPFAEKHGTDWGHIVDPTFMVQRMDGLDGKTDDGRIYGAHSHMYDDNFLKIEAELVQRDANREGHLKHLLAPFVKKHEIKKLNEALARIVHGPGSPMLKRMSV